MAEFISRLPAQGSIPQIQEPPAWDEIKSSDEYKALSYPDQLKLASQWGTETKAYASTLPDYSPEQDAQIDEFVGTKAVDVPADIRIASGAAGLVKGAAAGMGAIAAGAAGALTGPAAPVAIPALAVAGGIAAEKIAQKGLETFTPKALEAQKFAPTEAKVGELAPVALTAGAGAAGLAKAGGTLFRELGAKKATEELSKTVYKGAALGAGIGTGARVLTGGEVTPGTVATDALLGALYTGLGSGARVKGYNRDEAIALNERVKSGKASNTEFRDWNAILAEAQKTGARGVEGATRTTVELGGKPVFEKTQLTGGIPTSTKPYYEPIQAPISREIQVVGRPPEQPEIKRAMPAQYEQLPEVGVRGLARGTQADTAEMQRRGIPTEIQAEFTDLTAPTPRKKIFSIESQGINRNAIIPSTEGMRGEIVKEGPIITPRTQLPSGEKLALPAQGEFRPEKPAVESANIIEAQKAIEERIRQSGIGRKELRKELEAGKTTIPKPMAGRAGEAGFVNPAELAQAAKIGAENTKRVARNYMTYQGALSPEMADELLANKYNKAGMEFAIKTAVRDYRNALKQTTGATELSPELKDKINQYLDGKIGVEALPKPLQLPVEKFRNDIDTMSRGIALELNTLTPEKRATIEANIGSYVSRDYEKFRSKGFDMKTLEKRDQVKFARSVDFVRRQIIDDARMEVEDAAENGRPPVEWLRQVNETGVVPKNRLMGEVQRIVEEGSLAQRQGGEFEPGSYGINKPLSMLKGRKEIPEEIRYLLGEYTDPAIRYARTMQKMINLRVNNRTLQNLRDQGFKAGLFFDYAAPNTIRFASEDSKTLEPLNGVYMPKDVADQIKNFDVSTNSTAAYKTFAAMNAWIKWAKTVGSIKSQARNFIFNIPIQLQNGNFSFMSEAGKTARMIQSDYGFGPDTESIRSSLRRAIKLGVANNAKFNEMEALMRDASISNDRLDEVVEKYFNKNSAEVARNGWESVKAVKDFMDFMYRSGDNFHKMQLWGYRTRALMDGKGLSREQAEIEAADWVSNVFPTYEKIGRALKAFRQNPFAKNFISWDAERIRNTYNSIKSGIEDFNTPGMRKYGIRTLLGNIMSAALSASTKLMTAAATGGALAYTYKKIDELNQLAPRYQKFSTLLPVGYNKDKKEVTYIDMSFSDPFDVFRQPINAFMSADSLDKALGNAIAAFVGNFAGVSIATELGFGLIKNQKADGSPITNPKASLGKQSIDYGQYLLRAIEPGTVADMRQLYYAIKGEPDPFFGPRAPVPSLPGMLSSFTGFRVQKLNLADELAKKAVTFNSDIAKSTSLLSSELRRRGTPSAGDIGFGAQEMFKAREESFKDMRKAYKAAIDWGLNASEAAGAMANGNMSKQNIQAIITGQLPRYMPGRGMMRDLMREVPEDIRRRQEIMQSILEEQQ